jgi:GntR family transcriptional regulator
MYILLYTLKNNICRQSVQSFCRALLKGCCRIIDIIINPHSQEALYKQVAFQIKLLIADGRLKVGDNIPSVRNLTKMLSVSTITIQRAYADLQRDGIIKGIAGKGSFVANGVSKSSLKDGLLSQVEEITKQTIIAAKQNGVKLVELQELINALWEEND